MNVASDSKQAVIGCRKVLQTQFICLSITILLSGCAGHSHMESICYDTDCHPENVFQDTSSDADLIGPVQTVAYAEEIPAPEINENLLRDVPEPVSYTHLTLPTILLV